MSTSRKPLLCLDFDGVLHSYTSGWQGADVVSDPPVPGAMEALADYTERFRVAIHSSRSGQPGGIEAMRNWLYRHLMEWDAHLMQAVMGRIEWPTSKPATFVTIDDRALTFTGTWPEPQDLAAFQPWNKRTPVEDTDIAVALRQACDNAGCHDLLDADAFSPSKALRGLRDAGFDIVRRT